MIQSIWKPSKTSFIRLYSQPDKLSVVYNGSFASKSAHDTPCHNLLKAALNSVRQITWNVLLKTGVFPSFK